MTGGPDGSGQRLAPRRQVQTETGSRGRLLPCGFLGQRPKPPEGGWRAPQPTSSRGRGGGGGPRGGGGGGAPPPPPPEVALTIGAALTKPAAGHHIRRQAQVRQWQQTAPLEKPSRAIPLTWEICDFPSHGEPQAVFQSVAALDPTVQCCYMAPENGRVKERLAAQRLCVQSAALRELGKLCFPNSTDSRGWHLWRRYSCATNLLGLAAGRGASQKFL